MEIFLRKEVKFLLPAIHIPGFSRDLSSFLVPDNYTRTGPYRVRSMYFESHDFSTLRDKLYGHSNRYKLRVRTYPGTGNAAPVFAEIKRKATDIIRKERFKISHADLTDLVNCEYSGFLERHTDAPAAKHFVSAKINLGAAIPLVIDYGRYAFVHPCESKYLRIVLDFDLRCWSSPDLFSQPPAATDSWCVVEMKSDMPPQVWMQALIEKYGLIGQSVSKFQTACFRIGT